jgi:hypothetical protein
MKRSRSVFDSPLGKGKTPYYLRARNEVEESTHVRRIKALETLHRVRQSKEKSK